MGIMTNKKNKFRFQLVNNRHPSINSTTPVNYTSRSQTHLSTAKLPKKKTTRLLAEQLSLARSLLSHHFPRVSVSYQQMNVLSCYQGVLKIAKEFCRPKEIENTTGNLKDRHYKPLQDNIKLLWVLVVSLNTENIFSSFFNVVASSKS